MNANVYIAEIEYGTPAYDETVRLRTKILRKPLGLEYTAEQLSREWLDTHLACFDQKDELIACLILTKLDENSVKMRQVAVDDTLQGKGIGTILVEASERWAKANGYRRIEMHARETAVPFYVRLGYQKIGQQFLEVNIPHFKMAKDLV